MRRWLVYMDSVVIDDRALAHVAVETTNIDLLNFLIEHGAKGNAKDSDGNTPLVGFES